MTSDAQERQASSEANSNQLVLPTFIMPSAGEMITSSRTSTTYRIGARIGEGFFSYVFECVDDWNNRLVAKVLKPRQKPYEEIQGAALAELMNLFQARHPFITYVHDAFEYRNTFYLITERCSGPLSEMWTVPSYNGAVWTMAIARCLLQAMDFIHSLGMVHQDIHPGNVFLNFVTDSILPANMASNFKLGDLGLAKLAHEINPENTFLAEWIRPPESLDSARFGPMDCRVDLYHCGLLLMQTLLGKQLQFTRDQILEGAPRQMALTLPAPYSTALEKALRRRVMYRTSSAKELWRDLNSPVGPPEATA